MRKVAITFLSLFLVITMMSGCTKKEKAPNNTTLVTFDEGKTYDDTKIYESGIISTSDVILKGTTFNGDLTIAKSVGEGNVTLDGVKINGNLIIEGGGSNSIHIDNCEVKSITSARQDGNVRIVVSENTKEQSIEVAGDTKLEVSGQVEKLSVSSNATHTEIMVEPTAKVKTVEVNAPVILTVQAPISELNLNAKSMIKL